MSKLIKDGKWKQDAPELNLKSHSKGSEYLRYFCFLIVNTFAVLGLRFLLLSLPPCGCEPGCLFGSVFPLAFSEQVRLSSGTVRIFGTPEELYFEQHIATENEVTLCELFGKVEGKTHRTWCEWFSASKSEI